MARQQGRTTRWPRTSRCPSRGAPGEADRGGAGRASARARGRGRAGPGRARRGARSRGRWRSSSTAAATCGWTKPSSPVWKVQKALDAKGIEYEVVKGPNSRGKRTDLIEHTRQDRSPRRSSSRTARGTARAPTRWRGSTRASCSRPSAEARYTVPSAAMSSAGRAPGSHRRWSAVRPPSSTSAGKSGFGFGSTKATTTFRRDSFDPRVPRHACRARRNRECEST